MDNLGKVHRGSNIYTGVSLMVHQHLWLNLPHCLILFCFRRQRGDAVWKKEDKNIKIYFDGNVRVSDAAVLIVPPSHR